MGEANPSGLFSVFILAICTLVLLPYTAYHFLSGSEEDAKVQPWQKVGVAGRGRMLC